MKYRPKLDPKVDMAGATPETLARALPRNRDRARDGNRTTATKAHARRFVAPGMPALDLPDRPDDTRGQAGRVAAVDPVEGYAVPFLEAMRGEDVEQAGSGLPFRPRLVGGVDLAAELGLGPAEGEAGDAETARDLLEVGRRAGVGCSHAAIMADLA